MLLSSFAQAMEVVETKNGVTKRSCGDRKISYTHRDVDGTLKRYIKKGSEYKLRSKFNVEDETWNKIGVNPHFIIQGYQALEKTYNGTPTPVKGRFEITPLTSSNNNNTSCSDNNNNTSCSVQ
jgi:hypothetical protein